MDPVNTRDNLKRFTLECIRNLDFCCVLLQILKISLEQILPFILCQFAILFSLFRILLVIHISDTSEVKVKHCRNSHLDKSSILHFESCTIVFLRTIKNNLITHVNTKALEVLGVTICIKSSINIEFISIIILDVEVTVIVLLHLSDKTLNIIASTCRANIIVSKLGACNDLHRNLTILTDSKDLILISDHQFSLNLTRVLSSSHCKGYLHSVWSRFSACWSYSKPFAGL